MRDLDLTTLRLFVTVCETRNIARAGAQSHIVGSAISKRLAQLEALVGTPLLLRRRHGVEPTAAGETLLEHARSMLASADRIERDMAAYASGIRGQVRVLATASVMAESLADDVAAFLKDPAHRDIRVDLEEGISPDVVHANLAISVVPLEVAQPYAASHDLCLIPLEEPWAQRRFAICFRDEAGLSAAARLLLAHLQDQSVPSS